MREADWPVTAAVVDSIDDAKHWYFPWYVTSSGRECGWDEATARPVDVVDWCRVCAGTSPGRRDRVDALMRVLRASDSPIGLLIPTYDLRLGRRLVLDGNHRLAAIVQGELPFVGMEVCLHGPLHGGIIPDLVHWT